MSLVIVEEADRVAVITLDRPGRHNALVPELLDELLDAFTTIGRDDHVRAVMLQAAGRSFSTGGDVRGFFESGDRTSYARRTVGTLNDVMLAMIQMPQPIVAAVHGIVTGGSLGLVLASDIVVIGAEAAITPWYSEVGFTPDGGWTALLPDVIGRQRTMDIILRNRTITPSEAVEWGLASALEPTERVKTAALAAAHECARGAPGSVRAAKQRLWPDVHEVRRRLDQELSAFVVQIGTDEAASGMERFLASP